MVNRPRPIKYPHAIQLRVSDELLALIDAQAAKAGLTRSDALRELVVIGVNRLRDGRPPE